MNKWLVLWLTAVIRSPTKIVIQSFYLIDNLDTTAEKMRTCIDYYIDIYIINWQIAWMVYRIARETAKGVENVIVNIYQLICPLSIERRPEWINAIFLFLFHMLIRMIEIVNTLKVFLLKAFVSICSIEIDSIVTSDFHL